MFDRLYALTADYDAMTLSPVPASPPSFHTTVFPVSDAAVFAAGEQLVAGLKKKKYFTDTSNFDLRCGICNVGLKGEKGARDHAMTTGRECCKTSMADDRRRVWRVLDTPSGHPLKLCRHVVRVETPTPRIAAITDEDSEEGACGVIVGGRHEQQQ